MQTDIKHLNEQVFRYRNLFSNAQDAICNLSDKIKDLERQIEEHKEHREQLEKNLMYYRAEQDGYLDAINKADDLILYAQDLTEPGDFVCSTCQAVNDEINEYLNN